MKASKLDIAYNLLTKKKKPTPFLKLWEEISQIEALSPSQQEDMIAQFYSDLCLDSRFVNMGENKWDLRSRHTFSETVIDTAEFMDDDGDEDDEFDLDDEEEENEKDELKDFSIVTFKHRIGNKDLGTIGIIGPKRMDYAKVISVMKYISKKLNDNNNSNE